MKLDVLAIGPHPDDIELTCAGSLVKLIKSGRKVGILDLTAGELGTRGSREIRANEAQRAAEILGVSFRENLGLPDGGIKVSRENTLLLITVLRKYCPQVLLFPYRIDRHPDHEYAHQLCKQAWFYSGLSKIESALNGKRQRPHRPDRYYNFMQWTEFDPSFIVDVSEEFPVRMAAIRAYESQFHDPQSKDPATVLSEPAFMEMIQTRAEYYGDQIGVKYGEPFYFHRTPGISDLLSIL